MYRKVRLDVLRIYVCQKRRIEQGSKLLRYCNGDSKSKSKVGSRSNGNSQSKTAGKSRDDQNDLAQGALNSRAGPGSKASETPTPTH